MTINWSLFLYPELRQIDKSLHQEPLRQAREGAFDMVGCVGIAIALVVVAQPDALFHCRV